MMWFDGVGFRVRKFENVPETVQLVVCLYFMSLKAIEVAKLTDLGRDNVVSRPIVQPHRGTIHLQHFFWADSNMISCNIVILDPAGSSPNSLWNKSRHARSTSGLTGPLYLLGALTELLIVRTWYLNASLTGAGF